MNRILQRARRAWLACALAGIAAVALAAPSDDERKALQAEVERVRQVGPTDVALNDQAVLKLPSGMMYVPQPAA